jgi:hypothetical protein
MGLFGAQAHPGRARLGVRVARPSETVVEQLDLPRGQGVVLEEVTPQSAADKAGLKAHDILLELDGKPVPSTVEEFARMVQGLKARTPVEAIVLRKGKRETIKGLSLPEVKAERPEGPRAFFPPLPNPPAAFPEAPGLIDLTGDVNVGVMTTTFRSKDRFTTRHQEGSLVITVSGKVEDGKPRMKEVRVQDGGESHQYKTVDEVPDRYRDKVKNLVEMTEKSQWHIDIRNHSNK